MFFGNLLLFLDFSLKNFLFSERVPSKGIHLSFQWQDIKSAYGLPIARSHIGLYREEYKKYFGLYTRNFIRRA